MSMFAMKGGFNNEGVFLAEFEQLRDEPIVWKEEIQMESMSPDLKCGVRPEGIPETMICPERYEVTLVVEPGGPRLKEVKELPRVAVETESHT